MNRVNLVLGVNSAIISGRGDCPFKVMSDYFITLGHPPYLFNYFLANVLSYQDILNVNK